MDDLCCKYPKFTGYNLDRFEATGAVRDGRRIQRNTTGQVARIWRPNRQSRRLSR